MLMDLWELSPFTLVHSHFCAHRSPKSVVKMQILILEVWAGTQDPVLLTPQVSLKLVACGSPVRW